MNVLPLTYKLTIKTSFSSDFSGVVEIRLSLSEPTLHLTLNTASPLGGVLVIGEKRIPVKEVQHDDKDKLTTLVLDEEVAAREATLALHLEGKLHEGPLNGYYRIAAPHAEKGEQPYYAPCFDQPAKKAPFSISLISPVGLTSLTNMPEKSRTPSDGSFPSSFVLTSDFLAGKKGKLEDATSDECETKVWELVEFEETPKMSTYLATWAVGAFESIISLYTSPLTNEPVPVTIYGSKSAGHLASGQGQLALDTLVGVMPIYEKPTAWENWTYSITGQTSSVLHDPNTSGISAMLQVVGTVSHEAAHMYFGYLVTLVWWDEQMGEIVAIEHLHPMWNAHSNFLKSHRTSALPVDALRNSDAVHIPCEHESQVAQTFDHISYEKGSAVLKMLMSLIGEDKFLDGTAKYLKTHLYGSTTSKDLCIAFSTVCDLDAAKLMSSWIEEVGYPVVSVEEDGEDLKLKQSRFLDGEVESTTWTIPLFVKSVGSNALLKPVMMSARELVLPRPGELYLLNAGADGFYRVAYPPSHLVKLAEEAKKPNSGLTVTDRVGILQDVVALSEAGYSSTTSTLDYLRRIAFVETEYLAWTEIGSAIKRLVDGWWKQPDETIEALKKLARELAKPMVERVEFVQQEGEDADKRRLRALILSGAALAEDPAVLSWIRDSFASFLIDRVDPTAADVSSTIVWATTAAIAGLTGSREVGLLMRTAGMLTSGEVQPERLPHILGGLAANPVSRRLVCFSSETDAGAVEAFFADKDTSAFDRPLQQALDSVRSKACWLARNAQPVQSWLEKEGFLKPASRDSGFAQ
ncbi:hypothetical protein JCM8547_000365 [Rhodosporidiobolus lusitaniae]